MVYLLVGEVLLNVVFLAVLWTVSYLLKNKMKYIRKLEKNVRSLKRRDAKNNSTLTPHSQQRKSFRVDVPLLSCHITIKDIGNPSMQKLIHRTLNGYIENISSTGLKFSCDYNLPIQQEITVDIQFILRGEDNNVTASFVRKQEYATQKGFQYGVHFKDISSQEQEKLTVLLHKIEADRRMKIS